MAITITVTNRKGGVGKTTIAVHLAAGLATKGLRVALIDTDSQGHCSDMFNLAPRDALYDVIVDKADLAGNVVVLPADVYSTGDSPSQGQLFLLQGGIKTHKIPSDLPQTEAFRFYDVIEELSEMAELDVIIIDTQPTMSGFDGSVYLATDAFLYVTELEDLAIGGLIQAYGQMESFLNARQKYLGKSTRVLGIIPNKIRKKTVLHQHNLSMLAQKFGVFHEGGLLLPPLRLLTVWGQAGNDRSTIYTFEPDTEAARDMWQIVDSIEERVRQWQVERK